jgi:hypothetical protein
METFTAEMQVIIGFAIAIITMVAGFGVLSVKKYKEWRAEVAPPDVDNSVRVKVGGHDDRVLADLTDIVAKNSKDISNLTAIVGQIGTAQVATDKQVDQLVKRLDMVLERMIDGR